MKTYITLLMLGLFVCTISGCSNTWAGLKQTGHGIVKDVKDVGNPSGSLKKTDDWIRENMW